MTGLLFSPAPAPQVLRDYQVVGLDEVRAKLAAGVQRVLLVAPTGSGKTTIAAEMIRGAIARGGAVLFLAHRKELVDQVSQRLDGIGVDHGVVMAQHPRTAPWCPVQVASIPTLSRRLDQLPRATLVIVDEAHHARASTYAAVLNHYPTAPVIGLTATPWRLDNKGLGELFQDVVVAATPRTLIEQGYLVPYTGYAYDIPELSQIRKVGADYNQHGLELAMNRSQLAGNIVEQWQQHCAGRRTAVFCVTVQHSQALVARFTAAGVPTEHLDGTTPKEQREAILARLKSGETQVVCNVNVLTEGWDCLDDETEVLTNLGWLRREQLAGCWRQILVYALNRETGRMEVLPIDAFGERHMRPEERMVTIRSQHIAVRVTEGHELHFKYRDPARGGALSKTFLTKKAGDLVQRRSAYALPLAAQLDGLPGVSLTDDELRFVAWFMTDGGFVRGRFDLQINQSKDFHHEIRALLNRLHFQFRERARAPSATAYKTDRIRYEFSIPKGTGRGSMKRRGWAQLAPYLSKSVSPLLHQLTRRQFQVFWAELLKGDGEQLGKSGWLWCDRTQADAYMWMAAVRGFATSCSTRITQNGVTMCRVSVRDTQWLTSDPADDRSASVGFEQPRADEIVWCVKNALSTLVTRRRGKVVILGNCPELEVIVLARPTLSLGFYLQMVGRGMRPAPGKTQCRIHDHAGCILRHGVPDAERDYSLTLDPKKSDRLRLPPLRTCKSCFAIYAAALRVCPSCGYEHQPTPRELQEVTKGVTAIPLEQLQGVDVERRRYLDSQMREAERRGHKPGWAAYRYKQRFGEWPPPSWWKNQRPSLSADRIAQLNEKLKDKLRGGA